MEKNIPVSDWCGNFEITFQGEQGMFGYCLHALNIHNFFYST